MSNYTSKSISALSRALRCYLMLRVSPLRRKGSLPKRTRSGPQGSDRVEVTRNVQPFAMSAPAVLTVHR
jgi:hypothetical protein